MPHERLPKQTLNAEVCGKRPLPRPLTRLLDCIQVFNWNSLGLHPSVMQSVLVDPEVVAAKSGAVDPQGKAGEEKRFHSGLLY